MEMPDFSKGVIYKITTPNGLYIGSSCDFIKRERHHRSSLHSKNCRSYNLKLYKNIRENSGVWEMKKIKDFPCDNRSQLWKEETKYMLEMNSNLNEIRAYISVDEAKEQKKERGKEYRQENKEKRNEQKKEYYQANKEKGKEYYQANKEQIKERNREIITCECGCKIRRGDISRHRRTKKHLNLMSNKE